MVRAFPPNRGDGTSDKDGSFLYQCFEFEVKEEHRQKGVGDALMQEVHDWAEKQQINNIELQVYEFNEPALKFYEKLGYQTT